MVSWQQVRQEIKGFLLCYVDVHVDTASGRQGMLALFIILFFNLQTLFWEGMEIIYAKSTSVFHMTLLTLYLQSKLLSKRRINTEGSQLTLPFTQMCKNVPYGFPMF